MEKAKIIVVLTELRRISWAIALYNRENFQLRDRSKFCRNIGAMIFYTFCFIMLGLVLVSGVWYCFDCNFDIKQSSLAIPISICVTQWMGMYISLAMNNRKIIQLIHHLQKAVQKRKKLCRTNSF